MSELSVLDRAAGVNGVAERKPRSGKPKGKAERKPRGNSRKAMRHARRLAALVGGVGVGVLGLSVVHCTESIGMLTGYCGTLLTPMVGVAYKPWRQLSLYANRIEGLSKGDTAPPTASNAGEIFAPYKSKQNEIGIKLERGTLAATLSAFQIKKPSGQLTGATYGVDGEQRNRGLELALFGEAAPELRLTGGFTLIDAELTRTNSAATLGRTPVGVPSSQANLGAEWDAAWLSGFTLTGSVSHTGKQYVNQANTQSIPDWTRLDFGARYRTKVAGKDTVFRASVMNVADRNYWSGVASYGAFVQGAPRTLLLSAAIDL